MSVESRDRSPLHEPLAGESDERLVGRVLAHDDKALVVLYRRHVGPIFRFVLAQVREPDDAEDLTSETFARMLRALPEFRGEASFRNWLYQIARNAVRNHRRAAGYRRIVPLARSLATPEPDPSVGSADDEAGAVDGSHTARVLDLMQHLPPRYRRVLELRFLEGRSVEHTAAAMGVTIANAKVLQHRALRKAAMIMDEHSLELRAIQR